MQYLKYFIGIFPPILLFTADNMVEARRHVRRQTLCSAPSNYSSASITTQSSSPISTSSLAPTSTPAGSQPPPPSGPFGLPVCNVQSPGVCQLITKCQPSKNPPTQDVWVVNSQCNIIGGTTGLSLFKNWELDSQLPYVIIGDSNSATASPSFDYAGGHYGVGGNGNPGWWCAIEGDGTFDCYATFNC